MRFELLNNSYKEHPIGSVDKILKPHAIAHFQRCFRHPVDRNKLYFVDVWEYGPVDGMPYYRMGSAFWAGPVNTRDRGNIARYSSSCQFRGEHGYFDVDLHNFETVEELNGFYSKIYHNMGCDPYEF